MTRAPVTLASRLTRWYAAIFVAFFLAAFAFFYLSIDSILNDRIDEDLEEDIREFRALMEEEGMGRVRSEIQREVQADEPAGIFLRLLDRDGRELYTSDVSQWRGIDVSRASLQAIGSGEGSLLQTVQATEDGYEARVILGALDSNTLLQIGESMADKQEFMSLLRNIFLASLAVVIVLATLIGWFMARQALRGVTEVTRAAADVANGSLDRQVVVRAKGVEIERLAETFNVMVERIRVLMSGMREMTDNVAHDLRSPLARIRANAEMALSSASTIEEHKAAAADSIEECDRLLQMINNTLDVAETEVGITELPRGAVDLSEAAKEACELFGPIAEDKGISLERRIEEECVVRGNRQYLQRMIANLLDNALKYTPRNGVVRMGLGCTGGKVVFSIRDTGVGIAPADHARIFDRFFRCDESRSEEGCGLGLSLARAVARAHSGDIVVHSRPGSGSEFVVTLPI